MNQRGVHHHSWNDLKGKLFCLSNSLICLPNQCFQSMFRSLRDETRLWPGTMQLATTMAWFWQYTTTATTTKKQQLIDNDDKLNIDPVAFLVSLVSWEEVGILEKGKVQLDVGHFLTFNKKKSTSLQDDHIKCLKKFCVLYT